MSTTTESLQPAGTGAGTEAMSPELNPRRWLALVLIAVAQLMIVLDAHDREHRAADRPCSALHISDVNRQWVITAYALAFGVCCCSAAAIADYTGRKRAFVIGLLGFAAASALGGAATNEAMLFGARAVQGVFGALMAPAALSLLTVTFTEEKERARAFGVYGAIAGGGTAIGLIMGGVLTEYASWRWTLLVNVPIAVVAAFFASRVLTESKAAGNAKYDIPGALTSTAGLVGTGLRLQQGQHRRLGLGDHPEPARRGPGAAGRVPGHRAAHLAPAAADARHPGPQPGRLVPQLPADGRGHVRGLPLPDLLPAADPGLLGAEVRASPSCPSPSA